LAEGPADIGFCPLGQPSEMDCLRMCEVPMHAMNTRRHRRHRWVLLLVVAAVFPAGAVRGEAGAGLRVYEEQLRVQLDRQLPREKEVAFDGGGWLNFALFNYDDPAGRKHRMLRQYELRGWGRFNVGQVHRGYVRGLLSFDDWNAGHNPNANHNDEFNEAVERAWYQLDLGKMLGEAGVPLPVGLRVKAGRQYVEMGTALALSMPLDMIRFDITWQDWQAMMMLGQTIRSSRNIDDSSAVTNHQDRCLWGVELAYEGFDRHRPFVYYLSNTDHTNPHPLSPWQGFSYDSRYLGIGSEGTLCRPELRYQAELVGEWGRGYAHDSSTERERICAMAFDAVLEYTFSVPTRPKVSFEYLFASGDSDRGTSATATVGGNKEGTPDNAFSAFGFRDTGIAFGPEISNLHMYALGGSCFPLAGTRRFKRLEVGTRVYFFQKHRANGPVSDTTAGNNAQCLGWEWDVYCNWRIFSDLAWTLRYGAFQPGPAYDGRNDSCRQFLYTGMVLNF